LRFGIVLRWNWPGRGEEAQTATGLPRLCKERTAHALVRKDRDSYRPDKECWKDSEGGSSSSFSMANPVRAKGKATRETGARR